MRQVHVDSNQLMPQESR